MDGGGFSTKGQIKHMTDEELKRELRIMIANEKALHRTIDTITKEMYARAQRGKK
jgi:hypothetical protein